MVAGAQSDVLSEIKEGTGAASTTISPPTLPEQPEEVLLVTS